MELPTSELTPEELGVVELAALTLPRPIAQSVGRFLEAGRLADVFFSTESTLRFLCIAIKSAYLTGDGAPSPRMNDLLRKYTTRPAMGHWFALLQRFDAQPDLVESYWPFAADPHDVLASVLRSAEPLINARTRLHGHAGASLTQQAESAAIRQFAPAWARVLASVTFLADCPLVVRDDSSGEWRTWMGQSSAPCSPPASTAGQGSSAALVGVPRGVLNLFPLTVSTFEGYRTLLEGLPESGILTFDGVNYDRSKLEYVGGVGGRGDGKRWFADYRALMQARLVPTTPFKLDEPSLALEAQMEQALRNEVERLGDEQRWHGDVARLDPEVCGLLDDALASAAGMTVVCGDAGAGKSTHLLTAALRAQRRGEGALFVPASQLLEDQSTVEGAHCLEVLLQAALEHRLHVLGSIDAFVEHAARAARDGRVTLFVDGLDELGGARSVRRYLEQLVGWLRQARQRVPGLHVVWSIRGAYVEALAKLGFRLRSLGGLLYRPTRRVLGGGDVVEEAIWIRPPAEHEIERRYEAFRRSTLGLRPEIPFAALDARTRRACANPRWMVSFLRHFHGERIVPTSSPIEIVRTSVDDVVYAVTGSPPHAIFPDRVALCEAFVRAEREAGLPGVHLDSVLSDPALETLVHQERESGVLLALQSAGLLRIQGSEADPFSSSIVRASDELIDVVLHLKERELRTGTPEEWAALARRHEDEPIGAVVEEAVAQRYVDHACLTGRPPSLSLLQPALAAEALLRLLSTEKASLAPPALRACDRGSREATARALVAQARATGAFAALHDLAVGLTAWPADEHGPATLELTARALRHAEAIERVQTWLTAVAAAGTLHAAHARFMLAEVLRDKGQWRSAASHYATVATTETVPSDMRLLATAARGECHVWLQEPELALDFLRQAEQLLDADTAPDVRCNLYVKQAIAERVCGKAVRATRALIVAEELADRHNLAVERAKIDLEFGLVASLLLGHDEAEHLVRTALRRHTAQGFVKGQKKGWFSLGYVLERANRTEQAIAAYEESLRLNEHPETYDLLGCALCHGALARVLKRLDPERATLHQAKSDEANGRLQRKDPIHAPLL